MQHLLPPVKNKDKYRIKDNVCDAAYQHTNQTILLGLPSARMIPASLSSLSAFARAWLSTIGPLAQLINIADGFILAIFSALINPLVSAFAGVCTEIMSLSDSNVSKLTYLIPSSFTSSRSWRAYASTLAPNARNSFAVLNPICPQPIIPMVFPSISVPASPYSPWCGLPDYTQFQPQSYR